MPYKSNQLLTPHSQSRRGAAAVLGLALIISLVVLMAVTMDYGYIAVSQAELRRSADAAAMSAAWEMYDQVVENGGNAGSQHAIASAASIAAQGNSIGGQAPTIANDDVEMGFYDLNRPGVLAAAGDAGPNAVRITLRRQDAVNGKVNLFFGALTGRDTQSLHASATAALFSAIEGFYEPGDSSTTINILPIALDLPTWNEVLAGQGEDNYRFDGTKVQSGGDGIVECNLYPKGNGSPGNRGTVDIGSANNSTRDLSRQILHGISKQDFIDLGMPLTFDGNGELGLNGDTGISAGIKDELADIIGEKRIIPIFESVSGNGNNATYKIVKFEGVRILGVKLTGPRSRKHLTIQPTRTLARGAIIDRTGSFTSKYLVTPVMLVD